MYNLGNTTGRHCDLLEKIIYLILCTYHKSHPTVNTSLIGFAHLLAFEYSSCSSSTPEEGVQMQICCSARAGTPSTHLSQRPALALPNIYPFRALVFIPPISSKYLFPQHPSTTPLLLGAQGPALCISSLALLPLPWLPRVPAGCRLEMPAPEAPEPSCHRAVTSEAVSPAGGLACRSRERFQLWHFKSPGCAGAHLSLPAVTWRN